MSIIYQKGKKVLNVTLMHYCATEMERCQCCGKYEYSGEFLYFGTIADGYSHPLDIPDPCIMICDNCRSAIVRQSKYEADYIWKYINKISNHIKRYIKVDEIKLDYIDNIHNFDQFIKELNFNKKKGLLLTCFFVLLAYKKPF